MNFPLDMMLEVIVCVFLAATIGYCATIDRRLRAMRDGQDGLRDLVVELSNATQQATNAIAHLRQASDATGKALSDQVKRGQALADELSVMVQAGNDIANRLGGIETRRVSAPRKAPEPEVIPRIVKPRTPQVQPSQARTPARDADEPNSLLDLLKRAR